MENIFEIEIEKINNAVREFVRSISEEYDCRMAKDFGACLAENVVEWSIIYIDTAGEAFYNNFVSRFPQAEGFNLFTLSILHEVGHFETEWEMEDETELRAVNEMSNDDYFNLFNERIATDWAGEWIENNFNEALALDNKFNKILKNFFEEVLDK